MTQGRCGKAPAAVPQQLTLLSHAIGALVSGQVSLFTAPNTQGQVLTMPDFMIQL